MSGSATVSTGSFHPHSRHRLAITDVSLLHEDICVQYLVTPVPTELLASTLLHECDDAWTVDEHQQSYRCTTAYRRARRGDRVVGALRIQGVAPGDHSLIRVVFSPFARTPGLTGARCLLDLSVRGGLARAVAVHSSRGHDRAGIRDLSANP